jgi:hypothetical protein
MPDARLRTEITALGKSYVAGIGPNSSGHPVQPLCCRRPDRVEDDPDAAATRPEHQPITGKALALSLSEEA